MNEQLNSIAAQCSECQTQIVSLSRIPSQSKALDTEWQSYFKHYQTLQIQIMLVYFCLICWIFATRCYASAAYVVRRCLSVCACVCVSVTFVHSVKTNKHIFEYFCHHSSHSSFFVPNGMAISDGNPLTGASNAGGADRNRDFEPINQSINQSISLISGFNACC